MELQTQHTKLLKNYLEDKGFFLNRRQHVFSLSLQESVVKSISSVSGEVEQAAVCVVTFWKIWYVDV